MSKNLHRKSSKKRPRPQSPHTEEREAAEDTIMRLNRFIARAGICSRRDADVLIRDGRVKVNGKVETRMGCKVSDQDTVDVNGRRIIPARHSWLIMNKSSDTITTTSDERGRRSVMDLVRDESLKASGLFPVGRLDRNTTGVLLITNDGDLAHRLMHPSFSIEKIYRVTTSKALNQDQLDKLRTGVMLDDGIATADQLEPYGDKPCDIAIAIHEGRNRQVRRMIEAVGGTVKRLDRIRYAGLSTKGIRPGRWRKMTRAEVGRLYKMVKL